MGPELTCRFEPSREMPGRRTRWPCWLLSRGRAAALPLAPLLLAARCLPPRTVALIRQTALAGFLTLRRIGHCVVVVQVVGPAPACLDGLLRWPRRDQAVAGVADHVGPPSLAEGFLDCEVILQPTGRLAYVNSERAAFGHLVRRAQANLRILLRPDTTTQVRVEVFGASVERSKQKSPQREFASACRTHRRSFTSR